VEGCKNKSNITFIMECGNIKLESDREKQIESRFCDMCFQVLKRHRHVHDMQ